MEESAEKLTWQGEMATTAHEINDFDELDSLTLLWRSLLNQTRGATYFHSLDWLRSRRRHDDEERLRVVVVSSIDGPLGILPLVARRRWTPLGSVRVLAYPVGESGAVYGPIGPNPTATLVTGLKHVNRGPRDWDMLDLRWIDEAGTDRGRTRRALDWNELAARRSGREGTARISFQGDWSAYWMSRPASWRANVGRLEEELAAIGPIHHERHRPLGAAADDADPRWDLVEACRRIMGDAGSGGGGAIAIAHDAHEAAVRAGAVDMNVLYVNERPAAFAYNYHWRGGLVAASTGCDAAFASQGADAVLMRRMLRDSFRRGDATFDFDAESLADGRRWMTAPRPCLALTHYRLAAPRAQFLRMRQWLERRALA